MESVDFLPEVESEDSTDNYKSIIGYAKERGTIVIDYRADDKYSESIMDKLESIEQIIQVDRFIEGIYFLVEGSLNELFWVSTKIMYQRYPVLTFSFYESITIMNISKTAVAFPLIGNDPREQLKLKHQEPNNKTVAQITTSLKNWDPSDLNFINEFKNNIPSKQIMEEEYTLNEEKLRDHHEKLLFTVKQKLKDFYDRESNELEIKILQLYESSRIRLQTKFTEEFNDYPETEEISEESFDMEIYDVDIDDDVYSQTTNQVWEFDEPEELE